MTNSDLLKHIQKGIDIHKKLKENKKMTNPFAIIISKNENEDFRIVKDDKYRVYFKNRLLNDIWYFYRSFDTFEEAKEYVNKLSEVR